MTKEKYYYKLIKLTTGETIVTETKDNCKSIYRKKSLTVINPVVLNTLRMPKVNRIVESFMLTTWFNLSDEEEFQISTSQIIAVADAGETVKSIYLNFLEERDKESDEDSPLQSEDDFAENNQDEFDDFMQAIVEKIGEQIEEETDGREDSPFGRTRRNTRTIH